MMNSATLQGVIGQDYCRFTRTIAQVRTLKQRCKRSIIDVADMENFDTQLDFHKYKFYK